jgi:hypothetical protein
MLGYNMLNDELRCAHREGGSGAWLAGPHSKSSSLIGLQ